MSHYTNIHEFTMSYHTNMHEYTLPQCNNMDESAGRAMLVQLSVQSGVRCEFNCRFSQVCDASSTVGSVRCAMRVQLSVQPGVRCEFNCRFSQACDVNE